MPIDLRTHGSGPTETVITTMLIRQADGRMTRDEDLYLGMFDRLVETGMPIVLYLDRSLIGRVSAPNVTVVPISIEELDIWRDTRGMELRMPAQRNPFKDTADYLIIVNAKTELVLRTIEMGLPYRQHAYLDFGVFHVISQLDRAQERIRRLNRFPVDEVVIPGCLPPGPGVLDQVNWRFSGGFFYGSSAAMMSFAIAHRAAVRELLPAISWEVNTWAWMEACGRWTGRWYYGNHDDTILDYPEFTPAPGR
ncbi:MAG: hypothetical protein IT336_04310 [Thermomicrobiales bacterium]|nr:hypothetical protein [Thermomicrobiales bacterium]